MKQWFIDIEGVQKYLDENYPENTYLIEQKDDTIEIFVNELIDKDLSAHPKDVLKTFEVDRYTICVYTTAKDEELSGQLKSILSAIHFTSEIVEIKN